MTAEPLIVTGTVTLDTLHLPHGVYSAVPGGSALFGALGASLVRPCVLVGTAGVDLPTEALEALADRGVDLGGMTRRPGATFQWSARYSDDLTTRETLDRRPGAGGSAPVVPDSVRGKKPWVFLGSMNPRSQHAVLRQIGPGARFGLDTMAHWIRESRSEVLALVKEADTVFVSEEECALLGQKSHPVEAARMLLREGAGHVVVKQGERGACLINSSENPVCCPAVQVGRVVDPTGAGDAFGGAFTATRSRGGSPSESLANATAAASLAIEGVSFAGFSESGDEFGRRSLWASQQLESG